MPPTPNRRPRPINRNDTALTTGLTVNPNGTYIANPYPTTAAAGQQGAYGAMLPQTQVNMWAGSTPGYNTLQTPSLQNNFLNTSLGNSPFSINPFAGYQYTPPRQPYPLYGGNITPPSAATPPRVPIPVSSTAAMVNRGVPASVAGQAVPNVPVYSQSSGRPDPGLIQRIAQNPEEFNNLAPAQQDAVARLLGVTGGGSENGSAEGGSSGNSDFMNTSFMQQNAANNTPFEKQLRWDPQRKKYVQIGTLIREGRLNVKTGRMQKGRKQRRAENRARLQANAEPTEGTAGFTNSYGVVHFNTATG